MRRKVVAFIFILVITICFIFVIFFNSQPKLDIESGQREASKLAVNYLQMYNTMCTRDNYSKYMEEFKSMCTEDFYYRNFVKNNAASGGLSEDMSGYSMNINTTVSQVNEANTGYTVMIYEIETYGDYRYPYTIIVDLTADYKIKEFQKISHRFN